MLGQMCYAILCSPQKIHLADMKAFPFIAFPIFGARKNKTIFHIIVSFCIFLSIWPAPSYLIITPARQVWQAVVPMVTELMCGPGRQVRLTPCGRAETGKTHQLLETCVQCMVWLMKYWGTFSWHLNHEVDSDSFFLPYFIGSRWLSL